jgi:tagatose-6-phosphate ketose/aldose isomerase
MKYLGVDTKDLELNGGYYTAKEISSQPEMWLKTFERILEEKDHIKEFIANILDKVNPCVILTGAGTSAFIGEVLAGTVQKQWRVSSKSIPTTDIITHAEDYFIRSKPTLLVSFARSGDSPESLATVKLAEANCDDLYQLIITCNRNGELAIKSRNDHSYVFMLPEETNDKSLAMTSSFSSMLLAGLLILNLDDIENMLPIIESMCECGNFILKDNLPKLKTIAAIDFKRAVFLGSGPLFGVAHESHLKVQELSDGKVIGKYDSFLGFRHGPRAVVDESTLITYLLSNNAHARQYELDLIRSIDESPIGAKSVGIGYGIDNLGLNFDFAIEIPKCESNIPEEYFSVIYILPAQIIGFYKSLELGLKPDSPSKEGSISRVVQGVKIY